MPNDESRAADAASERTPRDESPETTSAQVEAVAALLRGESPEKPQGAESRAGARDESPEKKAPPKNLGDLAERLGCKVSDLYAIEYPSAQEGQPPRTLGQLKDAIAKQDDIALRELKLEESRQRNDQKFLRAQAELEELMGLIPKDAIKPDVLEKVRQRHDLIVSRERGRTLELIPEWGDEEKKAEELTAIGEHLAAYGFPRGYLTSIIDARTVKYIRDHWQLRARVEKALAAVQEVKKPPTAASRKAPPGSSQQPAKTSTVNPRAVQSEKVRAIAQLITKG